MYDDFLGRPTRRHRFGTDPMRMAAPTNARYIIGDLVDLFTGASKGRANEYKRLFNEQRDYSRERGGLLESLLRRDYESGRQSMLDMRNLTRNQLDDTGKYLRDRVGTVNNAINQVGQTARRDIVDQGRQSGAQAEQNLQRRGLGSSTMLAGAQAQNQEATNRSLSGLAESIAGLRGEATARTTGDVADFFKFRSQYAPQLIQQEAAFNRTGVGGIGRAMQANTSMDNQLLASLIDAAVGGKGINGMLLANAMQSGENAGVYLAGQFLGGGGGAGGFF